MSRHLFRGGTWDGRMEDVDPQPHIVVPYAVRPTVADFSAPGLVDDVTLGQHLYTKHHYVAQIDHPCIRHVRLAEQWTIYVHGELPTPDRVLLQLRRLDVPVERSKWLTMLQYGDVPYWVTQLERS